MEKSQFIRVYAAGGAGNTIACSIEAYRECLDAGFAPIKNVYIDTSDSDFQGISEENIYRFKGLDGSGALRKENHEVIAKYVGEILQQHKPGFLNIVLSSGGGGSGSVIAPSIATELLRKGENVIVIMVGSIDTRIHILNTLNTLKSYENIAIRNKKSLVLSYFENQSSAHAKEVDQQVCFLITGLSILFSGNNKRMDAKDLNHWINFDKVTTYSAQMVSLETVTKLEDLAYNGNVVSVATISTVDGNTDLSSPVEVQFIGYVPDDMDESAKKRLPIHFVTTDGLFDQVNTKLKSVLTQMDEQAKARVVRDAIVNESDLDNESDIGLIL